MSASARDCTCNRRSTVACQNGFSCGLRALSLSIKPERQVPPSPTTMFLSCSTSALVTAPLHRHRAPVYSRAEYLVGAEIRAQLVLISIPLNHLTIAFALLVEIEPFICVSASFFNITSLLFYCQLGRLWRQWENFIFS